MNDIVSEFADIVQSALFFTEQASSQKLVERCEIVFNDSSRLVAYESSTGAKFKYSYQWMNLANQTIYRWDNAGHFPQFETFPYHRHAGPGEIAEPFLKVSLHEVLRFIADQPISPKSEE